MLTLMKLLIFQEGWTSAQLIGQAGTLNYQYDL